MKTSKADKYFSLFIRLRDSDENGIGKCCTCSRYGLAKKFHNGHYIKRQHEASRFSEINCNMQCPTCNKWEQGNDVEYRRFLVEKYGEEEILWLELQKYKSHKLGAFELNVIAEKYIKKVNELMKTKNIEKWW